MSAAKKRKTERKVGPCPRVTASGPVLYLLDSECRARCEPILSPTLRIPHNDGNGAFAVICAEGSGFGCADFASTTP